RRAMERALKRELSRSKRYRSPLSLVFIDLDGFKKVNDTYGHDTGDELLVHISGTLLEMSRQSDIVARFAGDEFVLVLPQTSIDEASALIQRIRAYFDEHPLSIDSSLNVPVRFSCGIACPDNREGDDIHTLLKRADQLLYLDKQNRKARR
ncbi:GGDEF domain-containing protein, partial [archaeon]|nr:GGDEF domain-containing protein [archaeon]